MITDFDMTLTKYWVGAERGYSCYRVLECSSAVPPSYAKATRALHDKYYPIEVDEHLSVEEKIPSMIEVSDCRYIRILRSTVDLLTPSSSSSCPLVDDCLSSASLQWWSLADQALIDSGMNRHNFAAAVREATIGFRDGVGTFFELCKDKGADVFVFSAGLEVSSPEWGALIELIMLCWNEQAISVMMGDALLQLYHP